MSFNEAGAEAPKTPSDDPLGPAVGFRGASGGLVPCSVSSGLGVALAEGRLAGFYWSTARSTPPIALGDGGANSDVDKIPHRTDG
jgi:hypothetical protein